MFIQFFRVTSGVKPDIYPGYIPNLSTPCVTLAVLLQWGDLMFDGPRKFYWKTHEPFQTMEIHHSQWIFLYFYVLLGTFALIYPLTLSIFGNRGIFMHTILFHFLFFFGYGDKTQLFRSQIFSLLLMNAHNITLNRS